MKSICLTNKEILGSNSNTIVKDILLPHTLQLIDGYKWCIINNKLYAEEKAKYQDSIYGINLIPYNIRCPYAIRDTVAIKECWRLIKVNGNKSYHFIDIQYRSDFGVLGYNKNWREVYSKLIENEEWTEEDPIFSNMYGRWRSSATMPVWAVRRYGKIESIDIFEGDRIYWRLTITKMIQEK